MSEMSEQTTLTYSEVAKLVQEGFQGISDRISEVEAQMAESYKAARRDIENYK